MLKFFNFGKRTHILTKVSNNNTQNITNSITVQHGAIHYVNQNSVSALFQSFIENNALYFKFN